MATTDDIDLLREYVAQGSQEAFAKLVERHINMVYSVALRHVNNPHQAQEIAQAVFVILARKADSLRPGTVLSGWLFKTAWTSAANFARTESRRVHREQEVYMQSLAVESEPAIWDQVAPLLNAAIASLGDTDRNAVVLRFMDGKNFQEVGVALGASEDAAKMRVHRALEKLRKFFTRKGVMLSGTALAGIISANAVQAAPAGVAAAATAAAVKGAVLSATTLTLVKGATDIMAWTTKLKIAGAVGVAALAIYGSYETVGQRQEVAVLRQQLEQEKESARQKAATQQATTEKLKQEKLAMVEEKRESELVTAKLLERQRAETDAAVAKANAATARADALSRNAMFYALGELWTDPANREITRLNYREDMKSRYADLANKLKLSREDTDKLFDLLTADKLKEQDWLAAMWQNKMDVTTALNLRDNGRRELQDQLRTWLGDSAAVQYEEVRYNAYIEDGMGRVNRALVNNPLNDDQAKRMREVARAQPEIVVDTVDMFRDSESAEALIQQIAARSQNALQAAKAFLTTEQLATLTADSSSNINLLRTHLVLAKELFRKNGRP